MESWILHTFRTHAGTPRKSAHSGRAALCNCSPICRKRIWPLGFSYYYGDNNYDAALKEFEIAQRGLPNESEVYLAIGAIQRRQGKWAESTANLEKAVSLNPKDIWPLQNLAFNYQMLRNFDAANKTIDRALAIESNSAGTFGRSSPSWLSLRKAISASRRKHFRRVKSMPMTN